MNPMRKKKIISRVVR